MDEKQIFMQKALGLEADSENEGLTAKKAVSVPKISPFSDWDYYYLLSPIGWHPNEDVSDKYSEVEVPRGFVTDLASIPKVLFGPYYRQQKNTPMQQLFMIIIIGRKLFQEKMQTIFFTLLWES